MWHYPILSELFEASWFPHGFWQLAVIGPAIAIGVGLISYRLIEAPFLRLRKQWARSSASQESPQAVAPEVATDSASS